MKYKTACGTGIQLRNEFGEEEDDSSGEDDLSVAFPCIRGYFAGRGQAMAKKGASILASRGPWSDHGAPGSTPNNTSGLILIQILGGMWYSFL